MSTLTKANREVAARWTPELVKGGWTAVPIYFLANYGRLRPALGNNEAMLVIHLMSYKWDDRMPFPGFGAIAKRMRVTPTCVRNYARSIERAGYLRRIKRTGTTNMFDLEPLFHALERLQSYDEGHRDAAGLGARRRVPDQPALVIA